MVPLPSWYTPPTAEVDNVVGPAGNHVNSLDFITGNFKLYRFAGVDVPLLDQSVTGNHDEQFPFGD